jgi:hypothetical protein
VAIAAFKVYKYGFKIGNTMYLSKHFTPVELLPKSWLETYGAEIGMLAIDERILITLDALRDYFAVPITVNNWAKGGAFSFRGLRTPECLQYKPDSQHAFGRAIDFDVQGLSADYVRGVILDGQARWPLITRMEIGTPWIHIDCAGTGLPKIVMVNA